MPKKELPIERFRIWADAVDPGLVGPAVAALTKLGLAKVGFELIEDVRTFAKKVVHEVSSEELLLAFINDHPTFKAIEACRYFEANGRNKTSTYPALGVLVEKKILKKLDLGNYTRADVKHLAGPKIKPVDPRSHQNRYEVKHTDFILRIARQSHGRFSASKVKERFEKDGRNKDSVSNAIHELVTRKLAKRVADGEYVLLQKPATSPKPKTPPPPIKPNGPDVTVEATHG